VVHTSYASEYRATIKSVKNSLESRCDMKLNKLYRILSSVTSLIGLGMLLGQSLGNSTSSTPLWVGGILIIVAAVLLGMSISTPKPKEPEEQ